MTPERVRNVPKIVMKNVRQMRKTFHTFSMPAPLLDHDRVHERARA